MVPAAVTEAAPISRAPPKVMSMGMVMLPPTTIALPFKIMLFVMVDGWGLLFSALVRSFHT